ncbi:MAG: threonine/serine dehydratase [Balneolaceae bacterium]|nr:threonine/serine dehydratase [Balneolaceae bacterium]
MQSSDNLETINRDWIEEIENAERRIRPDILHTPLLYSPYLSSLSNGRVFLKMESEQYTGSFKARGSLNKLRWLQKSRNSFYPVTASTGNHGLGFARSLDLMGIDGRIYLPETAVKSKIEAIRAYETVEVEFYGREPHRTEIHARKQAEENKNWVYVSPYNDPQVIAGQGTIAIELLEDLKRPDHVLATVGGGGLISGLGAYLKSRLPDIRLVGCQPENSPEMSVCVRADAYREIETQPTLSDGSAGGFDPDSVTFDLCRQLVDQFILVTEEGIRRSIRLMIDRHGKMVEGSAAVAVSAFIKNVKMFQGDTTVIVICGGNISRETLKSVL